MSAVGDIMSTLEDVMSTPPGYHDKCGGRSLGKQLNLYRVSQKKLPTFKMK